MDKLTEHLVGLKHIGYFMAPDHAQLRPARIPDKTEVVEFLTGGKVSFMLDGKLQEFGKGTIFWHRGGEDTIWQTTPQAPYRCAVFHFYVRDLNRLTPRVSRWQSSSGAERFCADCLQLYRENKLDEEYLAYYSYSTLLRHALAKETSQNPENYPEPLSRALIYVNNNLEKKLSVASLAKNSGVSAPYLFKLFQQYLKLTPHRYILNQQMAQAKILLAGSAQAIKEIAFQSGFESLEAFYRRFRKETGITPGEYRKKQLPYQFTDK